MPEGKTRKWCTAPDTYIAYISGYTVPDDKVRLSATTGPYPGTPLPGDKQLFDSREDAEEFARSKGYLVLCDISALLKE